MTKEQFLARLEQLLADLSREDREDALQFYREYLEDAGPENEAAALEELGDVEQLAAQIRAACPVQPEPTPADDQPRPAYQRSQPPRWPAPPQYTRQAYDYSQPPRSSSRQGGNAGRVILLVILLVFTSPLWLGAVCSLAGILFGGLLAGFVMAVVGLVVGVGCLFAVGTAGFSAVATSGVAFIVAGLGLLVLGAGCWVLVWLLSTALPFVINSLQRLFGITSAKGGAAQ